MNIQGINNFSFSGELLDKLIGDFSKVGWNFEENERKTFSQYKWPDIVFSNKEIELDEDKAFERWNIDLLGSYVVADTFRIDHEGKMVLYYNTISKVAEEYIKEKSLGGDLETFKQTIEDLFSIVLIHLFVLWIMQWRDLHNTVREYFYTRGYYTLSRQCIDEKTFHLCFAQLFTHFTIEDNERLNNIFIWVGENNINNEDPYNAYKILLNQGFTKEMSMRVLEILKEKGSVSYKELSTLIALSDIEKLKDDSLFIAFKEKNIDFLTTEIGEYLLTNYKELVYDKRGRILGKKFFT